MGPCRPADIDERVDGGPSLFLIRKVSAVSEKDFKFVECSVQAGWSDRRFELTTFKFEEDHVILNHQHVPQAYSFRADSLSARSSSLRLIYQ